MATLTIATACAALQTAVQAANEKSICTRGQASCEVHVTRAHPPQQMLLTLAPACMAVTLYKYLRGLLTLVLACTTLTLSKYPDATAKAAHLSARVDDLHPREAPQSHALSHNAVGG